MKKIKLLTQIEQVAYNAKRLFALAWEMDPKTTFFYYLTAAIGALVPLSSAYVLKLLIDNLQLSQKSLLPTVPVIVAVLLSVRYVVDLVEGVVLSGLHRTYFDYVFRNKLQNTLSMKFQQKIAVLDIAHFENHQAQDLISKTRDTMLWRVPDFLKTFAVFIRDLVAYIAAFIVLLPYGLWIPILVTIITFPRLYLQAKYGAIQWSIWGSGAPQGKKLYYLNNLLQQPKTVRETRISQSTGKLLAKFKEIQDYLFGLNKAALDRYLRVLTIPPIIETVFIFFMAYRFLPPVLAGTLTIGTFTLIVSMLEQLGSRAADASSCFADIYENNLYVNHYFEFLALPQLIKAPKNPVSLGEIKPPKIEFKNVSFNYQGGAKVLDDVSFVIEPGESVALVGHNGAGKTTIVKLLCRFYDVTGGEILINGIGIKKLDLTSYYKFLGTLFQEFVQYHFTVRENIFLGAPGKNDEAAMHEAARKSGADEFIDRLPKKYDQMLGKEFEGGEELSGGQWQKLAIARAFYEEPPVLILDEPTSAIDAEAEYEIFSNLEKQYKNKTLVLVSHRFSTVRNAQKIVVLEHGKIIETGTHAELMNRQGEYAKLFTIQAKGYQ